MSSVSYHRRLHADAQHRSAAFSILELLLVLVILSILAGIASTKLTGISQKAKIRASKAQLSELKNALGTYELEVGAYPTTQQGLLALIEAPSGVEDWPGRLLDIDTVPVDAWGNAWQYRHPGTQNTDGYDLYSYGPDERDGGDDDIANFNTSR